MTEGLSDERIEHITGCLAAPDIAALSEGFARELLAEVKRVRVLLADETATCKHKDLGGTPAGSWYDDSRITDRQLAILRRDLATATTPISDAAARKLLAEVDRLREERDELAQVAMQRGGEAAKWSTELDGIGEMHEEWAADGPAGWMQWPVTEESEAYARRIVEDATRVGLRATLKRRLAGEWREVPHA